MAWLAIYTACSGFAIWSILRLWYEVDPEQWTKGEKGLVAGNFIMIVIFGLLILWYDLL